MTILHRAAIETGCHDNAADGSGEDHFLARGQDMHRMLMCSPVDSIVLVSHYSPVESLKDPRIHFPLPQLFSIVACV